MVDGTALGCATIRRCADSCLFAGSDLTGAWFVQMNAVQLSAHLFIDDSFVCLYRLGLKRFRITHMRKK